MNINGISSLAHLAWDNQYVKHAVKGGAYGGTIGAVTGTLFSIVVGATASYLIVYDDFWSGLTLTVIGTAKTGAHIVPLFSATGAIAGVVAGVVDNVVKECLYPKNKEEKRD